MGTVTLGEKRENGVPGKYDVGIVRRERKEGVAGLGQREENFCS
jgi:hypothetical protein